MTADAIRNLDALLNLKEELLKMKDRKTDNLTKAIEKRMQVQEKLSVVMASIKAAENNVKRLQEENNVCLAEIISILEQINNPTIQADGLKTEDNMKDLFLTDLMDLVDESSPDDDTAEILRLKMVKSVELSEQKLNEAMVLASEYDFQETMKIVIQLFDGEDRPITTGKWLEINGFRFQPVSPSLMSSQIWQELVLISHVITSFLRRQHVKLVSTQTATSNTASLVTAATEDTAISLQSSSQALVRSPVPSKNIFVLTLFQSNIQIGEVHIQPLPTFHPEFVQKLGNFCNKNLRIFCDNIAKVYIKILYKCSNS